MAARAGAIVAFSPGSHDAALMDPGSGLTLIRDAVGSAGSQVLAQMDAGLASPAGLAFSQDRQMLYVASATARGVAAFDLRGGNRSVIAATAPRYCWRPWGNSSV